MGGLWCAKDQPPLFQYFKPILERCKALETEGLTSHLYHNDHNSLFCIVCGAGVQVSIDENKTATCRVKVLCATIDLPAKAKVLDFVQFNGKFGCTVCKQEGEMIKAGKGSTRVYQYTDTPAPLRNHKECFKLGRRAIVLEQVC